MNTQQTLNQALEIAKQRLSLFATDPEFLSKMQVAFGETWQLSQGIAFGEAWQEGDFTVIPPTIEIRPAAEINGANGGYAGATNTIYISAEFLSQNATNLEPVTRVVLEEIGHAVDWQLNDYDTPGDEGAIFSALASGAVLSEGQLGQLRGEDDTAMVSLDGQGIERNTPVNFIDSGQSLGSSGSFHVSLEDLDGDGDQDAFVTNYNDQPNKVWLNDGSGNFTDSGQSLGSSYSFGVSLGDVDGDGDQDAFVSNTGQPNKVWLNDGSGNFTDSGQSLGSFSSHDLSLEDVDGDGDRDAFVANGQQNKVWLNDGSGNFTDSGQSLGNFYSVDISLADLDGDGDRDAFVANYNNQPNKVWLNDGSGNFTDSGQALGNAKSHGVSLGDVDGDGDQDALLLIP
jgi:hypothetical protein